MYGSWLPNDPRGTASRYVGSRSLYDVGGRSHRDDRRRFEQLTTQQQQQIAELRRHLKRPWVSLSDTQIDAAGVAIGTFCMAKKLVVWACAILPYHVHLVLARTGRKTEDLIDELKEYIDEFFFERRLLPAGCDKEHNMFADKQWIEYLDSEAAIESAISYVVANPQLNGRPEQHWAFVTQFRGLSRSIVGYND